MATITRYPDPRDLLPAVGLVRDLRPFRDMLLCAGHPDRSGVAWCYVTNMSTFVDLDRVEIRMECGQQLLASGSLVVVRQGPIPELNPPDRSALAT